jgi:hypothetical protein
LKNDVDLGTRRRVYSFNLLGIGYDEVRRLKLQFQESAGFGYKLLERPRFVMNGELGGQYQRFDFQTSPDRDIYSVRIAEDLTWKIAEKLTVRQMFAFMPNVQDISDYRMRYTMNLAYPLLRRVTLNLNVIDEYDTNPALGVANNDLLIQTTVGVSF